MRWEGQSERGRVGSLLIIIISLESTKIEG